MGSNSGLSVGEGTIQKLLTTDTTFTTYTEEFTYVSTRRFFGIRERNTPNDGGAYMDNVFIQELSPKTLIDFDSTNGVIEDKCVGEVIGENIISNPSFDNNVDSWAVGNCDKELHEDKFMRLTNNEGITKQISLGDFTVGNQNGKRFRLMLKIKSPNATGRTLSISGGQHQEITYKLKPIISTEWQWYHIEFTFGNLGYLNMYVASLVDGGIIDVDDFSLQEIRPELEITN